MPYTPARTPVGSSPPEAASVSSTPSNPVESSHSAEERELVRTSFVTLFGFTPTITDRCRATSQEPAHLHLANPDDSEFEGTIFGSEESLDVFYAVFPHADKDAIALLAFIQTINTLQMMALMKESMRGLEETSASNVIPQANPVPVASADQTPKSELVSGEDEFAKCFVQLLAAQTREDVNENEESDDEELGALKSSI